MSPQAGYLLVEEIAPRLRIASRRVPQIGADDADELYQDSLATAAQMLDSAEIAFAVHGSRATLW